MPWSPHSGRPSAQLGSAPQWKVKGGRGGQAHTPHLGFGWGLQPARWTGRKPGAMPPPAWGSRAWLGVTLSIRDTGCSVKGLQDQATEWG